MRACKASMQAWLLRKLQVSQNLTAHALLGSCPSAWRQKNVVLIGWFPSTDNKAQVVVPESPTTMINVFGKRILSQV